MSKASSPSPSSSPSSTAPPSSHDIVRSTQKLFTQFLHILQSSARTLYHDVVLSSPLTIKLIVSTVTLLHLVLPLLFLHTHLARTLLFYSLITLLLSLITTHFLPSSQPQPHPLSSPLPPPLFIPLLLTLPFQLHALLFSLTPLILTVDHTSFIQLPPLLLSPRLFASWYQWLLCVDVALMVLVGQQLMRVVRVKWGREGDVKVVLESEIEGGQEWRAEIHIRAGRVREVKGQESGQGMEGLEAEYPREPPSSPATPPVKESSVVHSCEVKEKERGGPPGGVSEPFSLKREEGREKGGDKGVKGEGEEGRGEFQSPLPKGRSERLGSLDEFRPQPSTEQMSAPHGDPVLQALERESVRERAQEWSQRMERDKGQGRGQGKGTGQ